MYPYIVVHFMPTVYQREGVAVQIGEPKAYVGYRGSFVCHPDPLSPTGEVALECRALLVQATHEAVQRTRFRMCVVWAADQCTFVERDGSVKESNDPPSGGLGSGGVGGIRLPIEIEFDRGPAAK